MSNTRKPAARKAQNAKAQLKKFSAAERTITVYLDADTLADIDKAEAELTELRDADRRGTGKPRLAQRPADVPSDETTAKAEQIEALRGKLSDSALDLTLRAMPGPDWRALKRRHPLADGDTSEENKSWGFDVEALMDTGGAIRTSIVDPELDDEDWAVLRDLPDGEWTRLTVVVLSLNANTVSVPFSRAASLALQRSSDDSVPPAPGG